MENFEGVDYWKPGQIYMKGDLCIYNGKTCEIFINDYVGLPTFEEQAIELKIRSNLFAPKFVHLFWNIYIKKEYYEK